MYRIGHGYDVHRLAHGEALWIGGVLIPYEKGAVAHSDGDVLLHAICDALLGALALGDIGTHFPDNSPEFKNIDSKILLSRSYKMIREQGYRVVNIDATVALQEPKLKPHISHIRETIADLLEVEHSSISVKATTTEELGFVGRGEGVSAYASTLLKKIDQ